MTSSWFFLSTLEYQCYTCIFHPWVAYHWCIMEDSVSMTAHTCHFWYYWIEFSIWLELSSEFNFCSYQSNRKVILLYDCIQLHNFFSEKTYSIKSLFSSTTFTWNLMRGESMQKAMLVTYYTQLSGTFIPHLNIEQNIICICHFNLYFKPYILNLITILYLCIDSWRFCNMPLVRPLPKVGHKCSWGLLHL